jgi:hypothetical protein
MMARKKKHWNGRRDEGMAQPKGRRKRNRGRKEGDSNNEEAMEWREAGTAIRK